MGAVLSWSDPFELVSPLGTLALNTAVTDVGTFRVIPAASSSSGDLRVPKRAVPGGDGDIFQRRFKHGYAMSLSVLLRPDGGTDDWEGRQAMYDLLVSHLDALVDGDGRVNWQPAGEGVDRRMLHECALFMPATPGNWDDKGVVKTVAFGLESPFPYAISYTQTETILEDGLPETVSMVGTVYRGVHPVFQVGEATEFTITNVTTGKKIVWDSTRPGAAAIGAGDYGEIDCFRGTMHLNGDGANLSAGFDLTQTTFLTLVPGENEIQIDNADATMLWNSGYA